MNVDIEYTRERPESYGHPFIIPTVLKILKDLKIKFKDNILDIGCGGGNLLNTLKENGYINLWGFDPSKSSIKMAKKSYPEINKKFFIHDLYKDKLTKKMPKKYKAIILMEVIEHLYSPKTGLNNIKKWLDKNGYLIITTVYHGYLKNLLIALFNKFDWHATSHWEGGHIKFFSKKSLTKILNNEGYKVVRFNGVGRFPYAWKSMILVAKREK